MEDGLRDHLLCLLSASQAEVCEQLPKIQYFSELLTRTTSCAQAWKQSTMFRPIVPSGDGTWGIDPRSAQTRQSAGLGLSTRLMRRRRDSSIVPQREAIMSPLPDACRCCLNGCS
jgi:hypothetical protein